MAALGVDAHGNGNSKPYDDWVRSANGATRHRVLACTEKGYFVLGHMVLAKGDVLCILWGGKLCFCLRPLTKDKYLLVGECYAYGFMNGGSRDAQVRVRS